MQISRTPLSCSLCRKVYETQPIGGAFNPMRSPASTPHHPTASAFLFLYILCLRSCRLPSVFIRRLPPIIARGITKQLGSFAPWELPQFIATANPSATFSPSYLFPGLAGYRSNLLQSLSLWDE